MPYGSLYFGKTGFYYKKYGGGGVRRNQPIGVITGIPANVNNKYVSGAGVGGCNTAVRRAKMRHATICTPERPCGKFVLNLVPKTQPL